ncbi:MAG: hypothetical protein K9N06_01120 [Candidatus Cloacimonetes bacterium]|nr:hypothetical protein [Candidatus Cloacimonadota bacterium]
MKKLGDPKPVLVRVLAFFLLPFPGMGGIILWAIFIHPIDDQPVLFIDVSLPILILCFLLEIVLVMVTLLLIVIIGSGYGDKVNTSRMSTRKVLTFTFINGIGNLLWVSGIIILLAIGEGGRRGNSESFSGGYILFTVIALLAGYFIKRAIGNAPFKNDQ